MGPNGSGKSNLFDALQFVFGLNKTKLRLSAQEDLSTLIHSSSFARDIPRCKVAIKFRIIQEDIQNGSFEYITNEITLSREIIRKSIERKVKNKKTGVVKVTIVDDSR